MRILIVQQGIILLHRPSKTLLTGSHEHPRSISKEACLHTYIIEPSLDLTLVRKALAKVDGPTRQ